MNVEYKNRRKTVPRRTAAFIEKIRSEVNAAQSAAPPRLAELMQRVEVVIEGWTQWDGDSCIYWVFPGDMAWEDVRFILNEHLGPATSDTLTVAAKHLSADLRDTVTREVPATWLWGKDPSSRVIRTFVRTRYWA